MRCTHCLRGAAQRIDIDERSIDELLRHCEDGIGCLIFSGGEPTLNLDAIEHTLQVIRRRNIPLGGFYVVTNGKVYHRRLTEILDNIYPYCNEPDLCGLAVSNDEFHQEFQSNRFQINVQRYRYSDEHFDFDRKYFRPREKWTDFSVTRLIDEGRAKSLNGYRKESLHTSTYIEDHVHLDGERIGGISYLNAKGFLIDGCNWSYTSQKTRQLAHISQWQKFLSAIPFLNEENYA